MNIDLAELDSTKASDQGAEIEIKHPVTGNGLGIFITVLGKHSQVFRDIVKERANRQLRENAQAERRGKNAKVKTADEHEANAIELLAACTRDWRSEVEIEDEKGNKVIKTNNFITYNKEDLQFNVQNVIRVYTDLVWLREQVDEAIGDLENFIKA